MLDTLSVRTVERLAPADDAYEVRDRKTRGFLIRVQPTGVKTWYCEYRRGQRIRIGRVDLITPTEARAQAVKLLLLAQNGEDPAAGRRLQRKVETLRDFLEDHYEPWARQNHGSAEATIARIRSTLNLFLDVKLNRITHVDVERWRTTRLRGGTKPATVDRDLAALRGALSRAVEWDLLPAHPLAKMKMLNAADEGPPRYLTNDEEKRLRAALDSREARLCEERSSANNWRHVRGYPPLPDLSALPFADRLKPLVLISINTGMRRGEMFKLAWQDVTLDQQVLTIRAANAKSRKIRQIYLNAEAVSTLQGWQKLSTETSGLVFPGTDGAMLNNVKRSWAGVLTAAKIERFRWHDLRHHFASKLAMAGIDLNTIRELLGHSSYAMTLRYAHLAPNHKRRAVDVLCAGNTDQPSLQKAKR